MAIINSLPTAQQKHIELFSSFGKKKGKEKRGKGKEVKEGITLIIIIIILILFFNFIQIYPKWLFCSLFE